MRFAAGKIAEVVTTSIGLYRELALSAFSLIRRS